MRKLKLMLKRIFCPPLSAAFLIALFGYASVILVFAFDLRVDVLRYISYAASAYALAVTVASLPRISRAAKGIGKAAAEHSLARKLRSTKLGERYFTDVHFRSRISLHIGLTINLAYIIMKLSAGIYYRSAWLVALAVYYILLAAMRLSLLRFEDINDAAAELRRYRLCGIMLLLMNQALAVIVIFMVHENRGFVYPGNLIYAMAFYAFYAVITAVVKTVKTRRRKSPVLSAAKAINLVAAMVSILSLETAMLARFGGGDDAMFRRSMTAATGGGVCTIVIGMAIYMILRANKLLRELKFNDSET